VRDFIQKNYSPYLGGASFLVDPTDRTNRLFYKLKDLFKKERDKGGVIGMDTRLSTITAYGPGYIDKDLELIVGLQTEKPLERGYMPIGGVKQAIGAAQAFKIETDQKVDEIFLKYRKTHNQGVFDAYTEEMRKARHTHIITGLPDNYGRGRIIGDYRRVALYGIDFLIEEKKKDRKILDGQMNNDIIQLREETSEQLVALNEIKIMADTYGFDISKPARNAQEAIQ
jgi:formate C-acetyltransferase